MGVQLDRFAAGANPAPGLLRSPHSTPKINPQTLDGNFNRYSKWIGGYPQAI